ncbi:CotH kinase family protein [Prolixibacter sp. NT017]|uniref:CotH kinase family protein n=1 Tax=Prolixibacter sp. NT017 TaxID=2652390 RepID=UPI0012783590|nr:CotH kinase family protein [Prolixibacter sp. NT017]GET26676.1 hypothetical protein NT017_30050 [Prolixibacter sp. NT017]
MLSIRVSFTLAVMFLLVVVVSRLSAQDVDHWESVVYDDDTWHYFIGTSEPPLSWADLNFDDSRWEQGPGGIGYGDNDDGTVIPSCTSVYMRTEFNIVDSAAVGRAVLHVDFDDGFVAYLNGHEIARANIGTPGVRPPHDQFADSYDYEAQIPQGGVPPSFLIHRDSLKQYLLNGKNILALQVHNANATSSDLSSSTWLSLDITDTSNDYRPVPSWFTEPAEEFSYLPLIMISTEGQTIPDEPKIMAKMQVINNGEGAKNSIYDEPTDYDGDIGIEIRGQSSQMFPKKSYSVEVRNEAGEDSTVTLLGMPEESDWVLYAPYSDKTMLRNALTYYFGAKLGQWQPRFRFCEVYLNGNYNGVYLLIEKIKRDKNRVDINKLKEEEISGDDLTGGYIVRVDKLDGLTANDYFYSYPQTTFMNARRYAFSYYYPKAEDIVTEQRGYIQDFITGFENMLNGDQFADPVNGYPKYIDITSFIDIQIMSELGNNVDAYRYSAYFYKKKDSNGGKLFAGPLWDFNLAYGNVDYAPDFLATDQWVYTHFGPDEPNCMHWWFRLMQDEPYRKALFDRWTELRNSFFNNDSLSNYINEQVTMLGDAIDRNFKRWPIIGQYVWPNAFVGSSYVSEVNYLKDWLQDRLDWMDTQWLLETGIEERPSLAGTGIHAYPNPFAEQINLSVETIGRRPMQIELWSSQGQMVYRAERTPGAEKQDHFSISLPKLSRGIYFLKVWQQNQRPMVTKVLKN